MADNTDCKRLYVGGLYKGVSNEDLRMKFKPFGIVKDMKIVERIHADSDDHFKTFAYINIQMTEKNYHKCMSTYNQCNWKGHIMKVELAKDDYLTRIKKEKEAFLTQCSIRPHEFETVQDIKHAAPGTPVPNRRHWVIGKFGRALPVVFLRRKDGKKIGKFDPSKTVHCLKKLSGNEGNSDQSHVNELTWSLYNDVNEESLKQLGMSQAIELNEVLEQSDVLTKKRVHGQTEGQTEGLRARGHIRYVRTKIDGDDNCKVTQRENNKQEQDIAETPAAIRCAKLNKESCGDVNTHKSLRKCDGSNICFDDEKRITNNCIDASVYNKNKNDECNVHSRMRKEVSNKIRLETLEERKEMLKSQNDIVKNALNNVHCSSIKGENHVVFDNDDENGDVHMKSSTDGQKIAGTKALAWLGMESSSDEEDELSSTKLDEIFQKKYFDGPSGEKLMKIQQTLGHDQRFKIDERFVECDDEAGSISKTDINETGDLDEDLKEEKRLSLKVLQDVLGRNSVFIEDKEDMRYFYRDSIDTRYDPSREDHSKFEEVEENGEENDIKLESHENEETTESSKIIEHREKFYTVSDSLKGLFANKNKADDIFTFFPASEVSEKKDNIADETETSTDWKVPGNISQSLPWDSSESESDNDDDVISASSNKNDSTSKKAKMPFFYHAEDQKMMELLQAESLSFVRKESIEYLTQQWVKIRQEMTQDYKKRRKDALRRQKRSNTRKIERQ